MRFANAVLWGFARNVPVIVFFVTAVWHWAKEQQLRSVTCALVGALVGSLLIRFTEPSVSGSREPVGVTVVNVVSISLLQVLFAAYLGTQANWSNWKVDLGLGSMAGISLGVARGLASPGSPIVGIILHSTALAAGGALVLVGLRKLRERTLTVALVSGVLMGFGAALVAIAIGRGYLLLG